MRNNLKYILPITIVLLIALVVSQIFLIKRSLQANTEKEETLGKIINLQEKGFDNNVIISLTKVRDRLILLNNESSETYLEPVKQINPNYFVVSFLDTLNNDLLQKFVKEEFSNYNITEKFQIGMYDCFTDSIIFDKYVSLSSSDHKSIYKPQKWFHDGHYFGVYFPKEREVFIAQKRAFPYNLLIATLLILVVVLFFGYTISSLYKQKKISDVTTDFINNMTHELKTPISTISLSIDIIKKSIPNENSDALDRIKRYVSIIKTENKRLENQVERVLRIAKLEKGDIQLNFEEIDIHDVIDGCLETFYVPVKERNGLLSNDLKATKTLINADIIHLTNIIYNLLDNANKYSSDSPNIKIETLNSENEIKILISDTGKGIGKEDLKHIFNKFYRVSTGDVHNVKGFGLGLFYVKQMVMKHRGYIQAKSKLGEGTTFILTFPLIKK